MNSTTYTPELIDDGGRLCGILASVQQDKRAIASAIAEAFINGMVAQERLAAARPEA